MTTNADAQPSVPLPQFTASRFRGNIIVFAGRREFILHCKGWKDGGRCGRALVEREKGLMGGLQFRGSRIRFERVPDGRLAVRGICDACGHPYVVHEPETYLWPGVPCLSENKP